jgi:CHAD domain-containing protein
MAPTWDLSKKPGPNIRRLARKHIDGALESIDAIEARADPAAVHDVRTRMKRLRAVVRMARPAMGDAYRRENREFRDVARQLGAARDAQVVVSTFDKILGWASPDVDSRTFADVRARLGERALEATKELEETAEERSESARRSLLDARDRVPDWPIDALAPGDVVKAVARNYKQGRRALDEADATRTAEAFHEWRKRAKYGWYHLQILRPVAPILMRATSDASHELSTVLGDHHDLVVFSDILQSGPAGIDDRSVRDLIALADGRRRELEGEALSRGAAVYAEKPKRFRAELRALWKTAA